MFDRQVGRSEHESLSKGRTALRVSFGDARRHGSHDSTRFDVNSRPPPHPRPFPREGGREKKCVASPRRSFLREAPVVTPTRSAGLAARDLVLVGAGHTNLHVVRMWRMHPISAV